jgi:hypothetical protein
VAWLVPRWFSACTAGREICQRGAESSSRPDIQAQWLPLLWCAASLGNALLTSSMRRPLSAAAGTGRLHFSAVNQINKVAEVHACLQ